MSIWQLTTYKNYNIANVKLAIFFQCIYTYFYVLTDMHVFQSYDDDQEQCVCAVVSSSVLICLLEIIVGLKLN